MKQDDVLLGPLCRAVRNDKGTEISVSYIPIGSTHRVSLVLGTVQNNEQNDGPCPKVLAKQLPDKKR